MSGSLFVDVDRFEGASSLTDLFETDALLDAMGGRDASYAELLGRPGERVRRGQPGRGRRVHGADRKPV